MLAMLAAIVADIVVAATVTAALGIDESTLHLK